VVEEAQHLRARWTDIAGELHVGDAALDD